MAYRGRSLKALRESKQIELKRIAQETRISVRYLTDIEAERFDRFPGEFYFKSFAREYATALGLDPIEVVADLQIAYQDTLHADDKATSERMAAPVGEDGILQRIAGYIRRAQEV